MSRGVVLVAIRTQEMEQDSKTGAKTVVTISRVEDYWQVLGNVQHWARMVMVGKLDERNSQ